jgi:molybdopterin converting factor small subunit
MPNSNPTIDLRLYATLAPLAPPNADCFPIAAGMTVGQLLEQAHLPVAEAKLVFVNGIKAQLNTQLHGGDRVGIFPPVGGG